MDRSELTSPRESLVPAGSKRNAGAHKHDISADVASKPAVIGESVVIKGEFQAQEDLYFDGALDGKLSLGAHRLTIGPHGKVSASIRAGEVEIFGAVEGDIEATDRIVIHRDARLVGDMKMAGIVIEDGAYFKGSIDITRAQTAQNSH